MAQQNRASFSIEFPLDARYNRLPMECFVGLGGNFENTMAAFRRALALLAQTPGIQNVETSRFYRSTPVSDIPQPDYLNGVCRFRTSLLLKDLWHRICIIEKTVGKTQKNKNAPRLLDLDLLFFGNYATDCGPLELPHPGWKERLFVLAPLSELVNEHSFPKKSEVGAVLQLFSNRHGETVEAVTLPNPFKFLFPKENL